MWSFRKWGSPRAPRRYSRFTWMIGFMGFLGFRYFISHELGDLFYFSFFAFFSAYFTAKLATEMPDERYMENRLKAKSATMFVPAMALFAIGIGIVSFDIPQVVIVLIAALGWAATFMTYAVAFWYFEKH